MTESSKKYIGLMSGTSLDGVDVVLVDLSKVCPKLELTHSHPIPINIKESLIELTHPDWTGPLSIVGEMHQLLGKLFADSVNELILKSKTPPQDIIAIGSHGQTVWHQPDGDNPFSMQLGDANIIAELTNITTVADFRSRDIAAGGQGAPLVPAFHHNILSHPTKNRIILNIGGIANISYLPNLNTQEKIEGFDTGPGNGLIDAWINKCKDKTYDKNGTWAASGKIKIDVLDILLADSYFETPAPKSTGKEAFNLTWLEKKLGRILYKYESRDIQATLTELTAKTIADNIDNHCDELFICGGGIHNIFLIDRLKYHLPNLRIASTEALGINPDWMEAIAFAWLAKQTMEEKAGNLPITTGAIGFRILGATYQYTPASF